ncbi:MAG: DUF4389 domain-containing protein [Solirubrobacterales bacterium]
MYPITYEADYKREPNRVTTFFRPILAIPWLIVGVIYMIAAFFTHIAAWFVLVFTARYPEGLYNFNSGILRYMLRFYAFAYLQTDEWPPFGIGPDPTYPIRVQVAPREERQSRLKVFFRAILIIPAYIVVTVVSYIHTGAAYVAWLTIVFRGYQPAGVHNALNFTQSYFARTGGYFILLTDTYPPVGAEGPQVGDAPAGTIAPAAPSAAVPAPSEQAPPPSQEQPPPAA